MPNVACVFYLMFVDFKLEQQIPFPENLLENVRIQLGR